MKDPTPAVFAKEVTTAANAILVAVFNLFLLHI